MAEYPKEMAKAPGHTKMARNRRDEVRLKFAGYLPTKTTGDLEAAGPHAEATVKVPQVPLAELVEKAEAQGIDVPAEVQSWETNGGAAATTKK